MRTCRSCREDKPEGEFHRGEKRCKPCVSTQKRKLYAARRAGDVPTRTIESAICRDCGLEKAVSEFGVDHARPTGIKLYCRPCSAARWRASKYGLAVGEYERMQQTQAGCCAICEQPSELVVDHDHGDGAVRGLLCQDCNKGLGFFGDDSARMLAAAAYVLKNHNLLTGKAF